ncbi:oligosaccharide flippase family protein [Pseudoroseomonas ludipueritiae]|uniref:Oligosaccharide flippase family protein n=1 Tax=Pseudoroseomonas ludipueritiae TaxID=198093 RepID=A0ABR7R7L7_9PROT|nr:oligosaccharide flippase family protein [Pseudoroseomonas ludipueritiae]MBC9177725.1 oligosaccharide flippase family protein [Pseudoroseomonas ludipueritiae]MCG7360594.1 oligosaccharide flippase family protein [Roseomonas sp. ACRSG]
MSSIRRGVAWLAAAQGSLVALQLVVSILIARLLGPYDMGIFAVALSIAGMLSVIRSVGLGSYIVRASAMTETMLATVFTIGLLLSAFVAVVIAGLGLLGEAVLEEPGVRHLLLLMAAPPLINAFEIIPAAAIERRADFRAVAAVNIARYSIANIATLCLAYAGHGYMSLGYGQVISAIVAMAMNNILGREWVRLRLGLQEWREVTRYGMQMLTLSLTSNLQGRLAELMLGKILGLTALGLFSRASGLTSILWENLQIVLIRVLFVDFAEQKRQGQSLRHSYLRIMRILTGFLWPAFTGIAIIAGPIVIVLFGDDWSEMIVLLSILAVSAALLVPIMISHDVFIISGKTARQMHIELFRAPLSLALFIAGCLISLPAAAAMKGVEAVLTVALYRSDLERMTDTRWNDYVRIYGESLLLTAAAGIPAAIVMAFHGWSAHTPLPVVVAGVGAGVLAWVCTLRLTRHPLFDEGRRLLSRLRSPALLPSP